MRATPSQTIGPFFRFALDWMDSDLVPAGTPGAVDICGVVYDGAGAPVPDAMIEVWQPPRFGRSLTGPDGSFRFATVKPAAGPGGQAPRLDLSVFARGLLQRVVTCIYFPDEQEANRADPVLAAVPERRRSTLVARPGPAGLLFDIHLQGPEETVFFAY